MKEVYIITTPGCEACYITIRELISIPEEYKFDAIHIINDIEAIPSFIKTNVVLEDFPTIVFVKNDVIKYIQKGTTSLLNLLMTLEEIKF